MGQIDSIVNSDIQADFTLSRFEGAPISIVDSTHYFDVIRKAWHVHLDREAIRHGLWKKYMARDQMLHVKIKAERVLNTLEGEPGTDMRVILPEIPDIINYSIFAHRIIEGRI